ncbi:MAG: DUF192 domain-containing protein [Desulfobacterales bacterium]
MKNKNPLLILICCVHILCVSFSIHADEGDTRTVEIVINKQTYAFELADTAQKRKKGLMFRKELEGVSGMLFVYPEEQHLKFYMKNTYIALDIAFISRDMRVINIRSMKPRDETLVRSAGKAKYALEAKRGFFEQAGLYAGDSIHFAGTVPEADE